MPLHRKTSHVLVESLESRQLFSAGPACPAAPAGAAIGPKITINDKSAPSLALDAPQQCSVTVNGGTVLLSAGDGASSSCGGSIDLNGTTVRFGDGSSFSSTTGAILRMDGPGIISGVGSLTLNAPPSSGVIIVGNGILNVSSSQFSGFISLRATGSSYSNIVTSPVAGNFGSVILNTSLVHNLNNVTITLVNGDTVSLSDVTSLLIVPPATGAPVNGTPIPVLVNGSSGFVTVTPPSAVIDPATAPIA